MSVPIKRLADRIQKGRAKLSLAINLDAESLAILEKLSTNNRYGQVVEILLHSERARREASGRWPANGEVLP